MMRKFSWVLLAFWTGCQDQPKVQEPPTVEQKPGPVAAQLSEEEVVVGSAEELKAITAKKIIWKKDGAKMVQIPYVEKTYDRIGNPVLFFYMDTTEVTVGQFKKFLAQTDHPFDDDLWANIYKFSLIDNHPIIGVSWHDATAYAKWVGKRLPAKEEWEWAARGGLKNKKYSWGDDVSFAREYANYGGTGGRDQWEESTAPVASFKPNGYGLFDMAGNVSEWCQDWYSRDQKYRVYRGGFWAGNTRGLRVIPVWGVGDKGYKAAPDVHDGFVLRRVGFRCVSLR